MNHKNHIELQGIITSDIKLTMRGVNKNFPTVFFMLQSEKDPVTKRDGTTYTPKVKIAVSAGGKLADACMKYKKGDQVTVIGEFRVDKKEDSVTKPVVWFPKIDAQTVEPLIMQLPFDDENDLPF